jgi:hypothetical protein
MRSRLSWVKMGDAVIECFLIASLLAFEVAPFLRDVDDAYVSETFQSRNRMILGQGGVDQARASGKVKF